MKHSKIVLPIIIIAQLFCTSLWFAGNSVINDLITTFNLSSGALGHITTAVQFGFIVGTLLFAILTIVDRFSPSKVFLVSAIVAAVCNALLLLHSNSLTTILLLRFGTGFFLAGIYPVGMKIAADHYREGLGKSLGFLVGALVLGTAFPHLLKDITNELKWEYVLVITSLLALVGGLLLLLFVPNGPYRKPSQKTSFSSCFKVFKNREFRSASFGYFGHMWELYAFWAFVPLMLKTYSTIHPHVNFNIPLLSFFIIGVGGIACVSGGYISQILGTKRTASIALLLSCICCVVSPFFFMIGIESLFIAFLLFWGMVVVADSPLFSTLVAQNAPSEIKGTALTIVNSIGFSITIISIQLLSILTGKTDSYTIYMLLAIGPVLGLIALKRDNRTQQV